LLGEVAMGRQSSFCWTMDSMSIFHLPYASLSVDCGKQLSQTVMLTWRLTRVN